MKPLILVLLFSVAAQAQSVASSRSIADAARQERQRQAAFKNVKVFTKADIQPTESEKSAQPEDKAKTPAPSAAATPATAPAPIADESVDPVQKWNEDEAKLRAIVRELQDREMADELTVNNASNQYYAPVTDPQTQSQAQAKLATAQKQLADTKAALQNALQTLQAMEASGPPKKP